MAITLAITFSLISFVGIIGTILHIAEQLGV